jgi:hypothetical protein
VVGDLDGHLRHCEAFMLDLGIMSYGRYMIPYCLV